MSDSARHKLYLIVEGTYGTTPATPAFSTVRHTGATLGVTKGTLMSDELRGDRQIVDMRHGNRQTGGEIQCELSYSSLDVLLAAALCGTWVAKNAPYVAGTISAAAADNSLNDSANAFPALVAGDKITVSGFTGPGTTANTILTVVSRTVSKIVVTGATLVNDAAGESVTITTNTERLKAGVTRSSYSVLRDFTDITTDRYELYTGVEINTMALTFGVEAIVKAVFGTIGRNMVPGDSAPASSTYVAANTNPVMDTFSGSLIENGTVIATVTELTQSLENGIAPRFTIGSDMTQLSASIARSNSSGQMTVYAEDATLLKKFLNQVESSIQINVGDGLGNKLRFTWPRVKYNGGQRDTTGQGPVTTALPFQALMDATLGAQVSIERVAA